MSRALDTATRHQRTIVEFESEEALQRWRTDAEHRSAKKRGVESFFSEFKFQICTVIKARQWTSKEKSGVQS